MAGRLPVPRKAVAHALAWAVVAVPALVAPAAAAPSSASVAAAREAVSAELLALRGEIAKAGPDELPALLSRQRALERRKEALSEREGDAEAREVIQERQAAARAAARARAEARRAAETPAIVPVQVPSSVPVPLVSQAANTGDLAAAIDGYLAGKLSPLTGFGATIVAEARAVGLDPRFIVAISGAETSFATYGPSQPIHNAWGLGPHLSYPDWPAGIRAAAQNLGGRLYKGDGRVTIAAIQQRWAPNGAANDPTNLNSHWVTNVSRYYAELGGAPGGSVFTDVGAAPAPAVAVTAGTQSAQERTSPLAQGPAVAVQGGGTGLGPQIAQDALQFLGTPYLWGGELPSTGFDCSGFVQYLYGQRGVNLPRVAEDQAAVGIPVAPEGLQAGDAIFFADSTGYIHHEGMYLGAGYFIHAPRTGDVVKISSLYEPYYAGQYAGARRY